MDVLERYCTVLSVGRNVSFVVLIFCAYLNKIKDVDTPVQF